MLTSSHAQQAMAAESRAELPIPPNAPSTSQHRPAVVPPQAAAAAAETLQGEAAGTSADSARANAVALAVEVFCESFPDFKDDRAEVTAALQQTWNPSRDQEQCDFHTNVPDDGRPCHCQGGTPGVKLTLCCSSGMVLLMGYFWDL